MFPRLALLQWVCVTVRLALAVAAYVLGRRAATQGKKRALQVSGALAAVPAVVMFVLWAFRLRQTAVESLDPSRATWWDALRPVHAALYGAFAVSAGVFAHPHAYAFLLLDVGVGFGAFAARQTHG